MMRVLVAVGVVLLLTNHSLAQANCDQIREAVAKYGYAAARQHALIHYGPEAVREGDKCGLRGGEPKRHGKPVKHHRVKKHT